MKFLPIFFLHKTDVFKLNYKDKNQKYTKNLHRIYSFMQNVQKIY